MNLSTRLNKIEAKRKAFWCPWCRYNLRTTTRYHSGAATPVPHIEAKCWFCGNPYNIPTPGCCERLKEAIGLLSTSHPTRQFTDERVHTAKLWIDLYRCLPGSPYYQGKAEVPRPPKVSKKQQARKEAAEAYHEGQMEHFRRMANGPASFPIDATLENIENACHVVTLPSDIPPACQSEVRAVIKEIARYMGIVRSSAACELVLWGEVMPETQAEISFFEQEQAQRIAAIVKLAVEQERVRIEKTKPVAKTAASVQLAPAEGPPPRIVHPMFKPPRIEILERANEVSVPMVEEETAFARIVRLAHEAQEQERAQ